MVLFKLKEINFVQIFWAPNSTILAVDDFYSWNKPQTQVQQLLFVIQFLLIKKMMKNVTMLRPHSPAKSPLHDFSPFRKSPLRRNHCETQRAGNLSPLRRRNEPNPLIRSPSSRTPTKFQSKLNEHRQQPELSRDQSYQYMESTIKRKCGLFSQILKKKEKQQEQTGQKQKYMIQTAAKAQQTNRITFSELTQRKKRGSVPNQTAVPHHGHKNFQTLISNVKQIDSIHCSKTQKHSSSVLSVKNHEEDMKKTKGTPSQLNEIFLGSFGSPKPSQILNKIQSTEKENIRNERLEVKNPEMEEVFEESFTDFGLLLRKISEKPIAQRPIQSEQQVKVSIEEENMYNFNMNPYLS